MWGPLGWAGLENSELTVMALPIRRLVMPELRVNILLSRLEGSLCARGMAAPAGLAAMHPGAVQELVIIFSPLALTVPLAAGSEMLFRWGAACWAGPVGHP